MDKKNNKPFEVNLLKEKEYFRLYVTHNSFKGRIRKRLGDRPLSYSTFETLWVTYNLKYSFLSANSLQMVCWFSCPYFYR